MSKELNQQQQNQAGSHSVRLQIATATHEAAMQEMRNIAAANGWPGPDVPEHPEGYEGGCFCELCRSYDNG